MSVLSIVFVSRLSVLLQTSIGIDGAGIGRLHAANEIRTAGDEATVLEAAQELGEVRLKPISYLPTDTRAAVSEPDSTVIQTTTNVSRLLQKWGVDGTIGENLVRFKEFKSRRDGKQDGRSNAMRMERELGHPWWVVHRVHLYEGLATVAEQNGANVLVKTRVNRIEHQNTYQNKVTVKTAECARYTLELHL
ncbi:hypothetical protein BJ170DRAFT_718978 [Xylariales sp. AK1849]|nr:hypothetical protein BJ170DRAFT_718978 [Xylariales sp. AK1849]